MYGEERPCLPTCLSFNNEFKREAFKQCCLCDVIWQLLNVIGYYIIISLGMQRLYPWEIPLVVACVVSSLYVLRVVANGYPLGGPLSEPHPLFVVGSHKYFKHLWLLGLNPGGCPYSEAS